MTDPERDAGEAYDRRVPDTGAGRGGGIVSAHRHVVSCYGPVQPGGFRWLICGLWGWTSNAPADFERGVLWPFSPTDALDALAAGRLDPDPLRPPDDELVRQYAGDMEPERSAAALSCGCLAISVVIVLALLVWLSGALATPRSGQTTAPGDVSPVLSAAQSGAPQIPQHWPPEVGRVQVSGTLHDAGTRRRRPNSSPAAGDIGPATRVVRATGTVSQPSPSGVSEPAPHLVSGTATWYHAPSAHDAAAGPGLRRALGLGWRGADVRVCAAGRCLTTRLTDWCACPGGRVIDLDRRAFARLADPSRGVVAVTVERARPVPTLPPTDTAP